MLALHDRPRSPGRFLGRARRATLPQVNGILLATDSDAVFNEVDAALASDDVTVSRVRAGSHVLPAVRELDPALVLLDLQIGNMGGVATSLAIKQEVGFDRLDDRPVALLLDRAADVFLAHDSQADGWLIKPLDPLRLRRLAKQLLAGESVFEGVSARA